MGNLSNIFRNSLRYFTKYIFICKQTLFKRSRGMFSMGIFYMILSLTALGLNVLYRNILRSRFWVEKG